MDRHAWQDAEAGHERTDGWFAQLVSAPGLHPSWPRHIVSTEEKLVRVEDRMFRRRRAIPETRMQDRGLAEAVDNLRLIVAARPDHQTCIRNIVRWTLGCQDRFDLLADQIDADKLVET